MITRVVKISSATDGSVQFSCIQEQGAEAGMSAMKKEWYDKRAKRTVKPSTAIERIGWNKGGGIVDSGTAQAKQDKREYKLEGKCQLKWCQLAFRQELLKIYKCNVESNPNEAYLRHSCSHSCYTY